MKSFSLHIGVNRLDQGAFPGSSASELAGCIRDAEYMMSLANRCGFEQSQPLYDHNATYNSVLSWLNKIAAEIDNNGTVMLTYSGHGARRPNQFAKDSNDPRYLFAWVLHNKLLFEDRLRKWQYDLAAKDVTIITVADCCFASGTDEHPRFNLDVAFLERVFETRRLARIKTLSGEVIEQHFQTNSQWYNPVTLPSGEKAPTTIEIAACDSTELASDNDSNGSFTEALRTVWDRPGFTGADKPRRPNSYLELELMLRMQMRDNPRQTPHITTDPVDLKKMGLPFYVR